MRVYIELFFPYDIRNILASILVCFKHILLGFQLSCQLAMVLMFYFYRRYENGGNAKIMFFIGWKRVAFNFPRSADSDSRDGQISFHEHVGMYTCEGSNSKHANLCAPNYPRGYLQETFSSVLSKSWECKSPCKAVGL